MPGLLLAVKAERVELAERFVKGNAETVVLVSAQHHALAEREHRAEIGERRRRRRVDELVFASDRGGPFTPSNIRNRAARAWKVANKERAELGLSPLVPIGLHECRHTFVSLMAAAGVPLERIGDYVGHSTTYMVDRYRHLVEGQREHDAALFDALITGARNGAQGAQSSIVTR